MNISSIFFFFFYIATAVIEIFLKPSTYLRKPLSLVAALHHAASIVRHLTYLDGKVHEPTNDNAYNAALIRISFILGPSDFRGLFQEPALPRPYYGLTSSARESLTTS